MDWVGVLFLLGVTFTSNIDSTLLRRLAILQSSFFCIAYNKLGLPGIVFMCLCVSFLIITRTPAITGMVEIVMPHFFQYVFPCLCIDLLLGITHLSPHNELVHLPYIAIATNTSAASNRNNIRALETGDRTRSPYLLP